MTPRALILACVLVGLAACGDPVQRHIDTIVEGDGDIEEARLALNMAKGTAVDPLIAAFEDRSLPARARVDLAESLYRLYLREADGRIFASLVAGLEDPEPRVRAGVARALGNLRRSEAVAPLLARFEAEADPAMKGEILAALEFMASDWHDDWGTRVDPDLLDAAQKESFAGVLQDLIATGPPEDLRISAREWLEVLAEDLAGEAEKLFLAADAAGAEELLRSALELVPGSLNIHQKLGRLFYANGDEERGREYLERLGMVARMPELKERPRIDGVLDEPAWRPVAPLTEFYQCIWRLTARRAEGRSEAWIGYRSDTLFVAVKAYEPNTANLAASETKRDGAVYADDCLEIFIDTNRDSQSIYHFIINTLGTIRDSHYGPGRPGDSWTCPIEVGTAVADTFWVVEAAIPVAQMEGAPAAPGVEWGFNVARVRIGNASEYGQWVPTYGNAHRPDRFGMLLFE
ncbi:MAG: HEAT repeat domain-containing protein [Acidimicrobiia bacterium]|nr:HEAT repeat domain-containing protein [Acidimicrobiia bacterium]